MEGAELRSICRFELKPNLDLVVQLSDLLHGSVVFVGQLLQLILTSLRCLLQVSALIFGVTEGALEKDLKKKKKQKTTRSNN